MVNMDSLTGTFSIPDRDHISGPRRGFSFALDEKGIVLVDDSGYAEELLRGHQPHQEVAAAQPGALPVRPAGDDHRPGPGPAGEERSIG